MQTTVLRLLLALTAVASQLHAVRVSTSLGQIVGFESQFDRRPLHVFYGVPYGRAPTGRNRFRPTTLVDRLPVDPYLATRPTVHCPQANSSRLANARIDEDCLQLNIWMPSLQSPEAATPKATSEPPTTSATSASSATEPPQAASSTAAPSTASGEQQPSHELLQCGNRSLPVLVYLYGGVGSIFMVDSIRRQHLMYDGSAYAALGELIFITINYRSGPAGMLYLPGQLPGNAGLFDQALALDWVQRHVRSFCGDPGRVTLMGNSYGSMAISLHLLSPVSAGGFQSAIMQSGSALYDPVWLEQPASALKETRKFAESVGCMRRSPLTLRQEVVDLGCLEQTPLDALLPHMDGLNPFLTLTGGGFFNESIVYNYWQKDRLLIPADKRLLLGLVSNEMCLGSVSMAELTDGQQVDLTADQLQRLLASLADKTFSMLGRPELSGLSPAVAAYYASGERDFNQSLAKTLDGFLSDVCFNCASTLFAQGAARALPPGQVHTFLIEKVPGRHLSRALNALPDEIVGVCHADEVNYNFGAAFHYPTLFDQADRDYTRQLIRTFARFVHGRALPSVSRPVVDGGSGQVRMEELRWPASRPERLHFVALTAAGPRWNEEDFERRCDQVWRRLRPAGRLPRLIRLQPDRAGERWWRVGLALSALALVLAGCAVCSQCRKRSGYKQFV